MRNGKLCFCVFNFINMIDIIAFICIISHISLSFFRFEKRRVGDKHIHNFIGFCTMYNYYFYNCEKNIDTESRMVIDQVNNNKVPVSERVNEGKVIPEDIRLRIR